MSRNIHKFRSIKHGEPDKKLQVIFDQPKPELSTFYFIAIVLAASIIVFVATVTFFKLRSAGINHLHFIESISSAWGAAEVNLMLSSLSHGLNEFTLS